MGNLRAAGCRLSSFFLLAESPLAIEGRQPSGDLIPDIAKRHFGDRSRGINEDILRQHAVSQLGEAAASVTPRALTEATLDGSTETFALARPGEVNAYMGVYLYTVQAWFTSA